MDPLLVYISLFVFFIVAGVLVWAYRHVVTRKCPRCDAQVELGRPRCQVCGYRFSTARF
jgi:hypothetical protein